MDLTAQQLNKQFFSEIVEEGNPSLQTVLQRNRATRRAAKKYKVFYDPKFQREYGSWTLKQKRKFILSVFAGRNWGTIAVADIRLCLEYAKEENCKDSIKYYQDLFKRVMFIYHWTVSTEQSASKSFLKASLPSAGM